MEQYSNAAIHHPGTSICKTCKLLREIDITTAEMLAIHQALIYLNTKYTRSKPVIYTDSKSSLYLLLSRHPTPCTPLVHTLQKKATFPPITGMGNPYPVGALKPSHSNIRGNDIVDAAAKTPPLSLGCRKHPEC